MTLNMGSASTKENQQERILALLQREGSLTKQEISTKLALSMPTTLQKVNELIERRILQEGAVNESTGGRRARKIQINPKSGYFAGIDIRTNRLEFVVMDLTGQVVCRSRSPFQFEDRPEIYEEIEKRMMEFLTGHRLKNKILGAGISFPGIIDRDKDLITKSHIFGLEHVELDRFYKMLPYPVIVENDANCMGLVEVSGQDADYVYVSLNKTVGGAIVREGHLIKGETSHAGEIGHMIIRPGGKECYCGKKGCADAYLSSKTLSNRLGSVEAFFQALKDGDLQTETQWEEYVENLILLVTNLRMVLNSTIVIGGDVGKQIDPYLEMISRKALEYDLFARDIEYLKPCTKEENPGALGAALLAREEFGYRVLV